MASATTTKSLGVVAVCVAALVAIWLLLDDGTSDVTPPQAEVPGSEKQEASARTGEFAHAPTRDPVQEEKAPAADPVDEPDEGDSQSAAQSADSDATEDAPADPPTRPQTLLVGRVVNEAGDPIAGATIFPVMLSANDDPMLYGQTGPRLNTARRGETDAAGEFRVEYAGLSHAAVLAVPPPPYAEAASQVIRVVPREVNELGTVVVPRGGAIAGRVTNRDGNPITGVRVRPGGKNVFRHHDGVPLRPDTTLIDEGGRETRTDANGMYRLEGLRAGANAVHVDAPGYLEQQTDGIDVVAGRVTEGIDFVMPPGVTQSCYSPAKQPRLPACFSRW